MAKPRKNLAFSNVDQLAMAAFAPPTCHVLFAHPGISTTSRSLKPHSHPFWQLEVMRKGRIVWYGDSERSSLEAGSILVIPPEIPHAFDYPESQVEWATFKFEAPAAGQNQITWMNPDGFLSRLIVLLVETLDFADPVEAERVQQGLLSAAMAYIYPKAPERSDTPLVQAVKRSVSRANGCPLPVEDLARAIGVSAGHLSATFRRETGMRLKEYIDRERAERAAKLLEYTDLRVSEVAEALAFPDLFTFSRFFALNKGTSPRAYRTAVQAAGLRA